MMSLNSGYNQFKVYSQDYDINIYEKKIFRVSELFYSLQPDISKSMHHA